MKFNPHYAGHNLTPYQMSAIIGFYRMGNVDSVIASVIDCEVWQVQQTIRAYYLSK